MGVETLEDRLAPNAGLPADLILGRTQSAYSTADVTNNTVNVTYTVYNQRAEDISGVLLTTSLHSGVTFVSANQPTDRDGPTLAWGLGTITGYGRASVTVTMAIPAGAAITLDSGARAFGTLDGGAVSADTPVAGLTDRTLPANFLASTPDANTNDPFVQEQAARLRYDPQAIFNYLNDDVGYESYTGSLRGARGTLWSEAGNSLDEASLGVALFRASGLPARYARGTLSTPLASQLVLSMFPPSFQLVGYIPEGTAVADPANDPQLLAETRDHFWVQYDPGTGFTDADTSGLPGGGIGTAFTVATETFGEVADSLRHKTTVRLNRELTITGLFGAFQTTATVLDKTFNTVEVVGRPLSIGNFVSRSSQGFLFTATTTTFAPYIAVGDEGDVNKHDELIRGESYQEVLTNFPFGSQILTGLFLEIELTGPDGPAERFERALLDRIGYDVRQNGGTPASAFDPNGPPALSDLDIFTVHALPGLQSPATLRPLETKLERLRLAVETTRNPDGTLPPEASALVREYQIDLTRLLGRVFREASDAQTAALASSASVKAYWDRPRIILVSSRMLIGDASESLTRAYAIDLRRDSIRALAFPGQNAAAAGVFQMVRGIAESSLEGRVVGLLSTGEGQVVRHTSAATIVQAAMDQNIGLVAITERNLAVLDGLPISPEAKARITVAVSHGQAVVVPSRNIEMNGETTVAWYEVNPTTGEMIGVMADGGHQGIAEYAAVFLFVLTTELIGANLVIDALEGLDDKPDLYKNLIRAGLAVAGLGIATLAILLIPQLIAIALLADILGLGLVGFGTGVAAGAAAADPPVSPALQQLAIPPIAPRNRARNESDVAGTVTPGATTGQRSLSHLAVTGSLAVAWSDTATSGYHADSLNAPTATVRDASGRTVGTGPVAWTGTAAVPLTISGNASHNISGHGSLALYGAATPGLGVSGNWQRYSATVSGSPEIELTTDSLTLNGIVLPAGTYSITASSVTLTGSGATSSPTFAGAASVTMVDGAVNLGPGAGNLSVGGATLDSTTETTLSGFTGTLTVAGDGSDSDAVTLDGTATHVLRVSAPTALTADQNIPVEFTPTIGTSLAGDYTLSVEAPDEWTVAIGTTGQVTVTPETGRQGGTFPIRIVTQSTTRPELVSQATINVTVTPTSPGFDFSVTSDLLYTVPFAGAQIPSAYRATVRNLGPEAEPVALSFANVPAGFRLLNSGTTMTVPAGETGFLGLYLEPLAGTTLPAPGTVLTFDVTATSTANTSLTQTRTVSFTMPEVHGVTLVATPRAIGVTPGASANATVTITVVGNVAETVTLVNLASAGLTVTGLPATLSLTPGQTVTLPVTLAVSDTTPLNSNLESRIAATVGPAGAPITQTLPLHVRVAVPGADAITTASAAAETLGKTDLANRLRDLSTALTTLVQSPTNDVARSQSLAALDAVIGLVGADAYLALLVTSLTDDRAALDVATTASAVQAAVSGLGATLEIVGDTLADAVAHRFTIAFANNTGVARPQVASEFLILLRNVGTETTTYDLTALGLPSGVTAAFNQTSVTLAPGQSTFTAGNPNLTVTLTPGTGELAPFAFEVRAVARPAPAIAQSVSGSLSVRTEVVTVVSVSPTPTFADPGVPVAVSARLLNAVNREQIARVQYTVRDAGGTAVFTSTPVPASLTVLTSLTTVALETLNTTGFARGNYTIDVTVSDDADVPIPGATGTGHLLIGSPVTASLGVDPTALPPGTGTVSNTLTIASPTAGLEPPTLIGVASVPDADDVVRNGDFVYVASSAGVSVFDIAGANLNNPQFIRSVGTSALRLAIRGNLLVTTEFDGSNGSGCRLNTFSLSDPSNPQPLGTALIPYGVPWSFVITDTHVIMVAFSVSFFLANNDIFRQTGAVVAINIADPSAPFLDGDAQSAAGTPAGRDGVNDGVLFNDYGTSSDGIEVLSGIDHSGGPRNTWDIVQISPTIVLVTGSSSTGTDTQTGVGLVHVVDISDPRNMRLIRSLELPGTVHGYGIAVQGNVALITATGGWNDFTPGLGLGGNLALAALDVGDPANPRVLGQEQLSLLANDSYTFVAALGGGLFATGGGVGTQSRLLVVDANDPANLLVAGLDAPADILGIAGGDGLIFTADGSSLNVYRVGPRQAIPATAAVRIPTAEGVAVVPGSFSLPPTRTRPVAGGTTYEWDLSLTSTTSITWQSTVTNVQPGRSRSVASNGAISFVSQGTAGEVDLADQFVTGVQILGLTPASQSAAPGEAVAYGVVLTNPTGSSVTYNLGVAGVPASWVGLVASTSVPANGTVTVPMTLTADAYAALADYGLTITASAGTVRSSVGGTLTLAGTPVMPDPESHGVVITMTPTNATAGPGTTAMYVVRVTNTGSATATFDLTASLPAGLTGVLSQSSVAVPPGAGNFREVTLLVTPAAGTTPGDFTIGVTASAGAVSDLAEALLTVVNRGVTVTLDRNAFAPGESATATVTNTGSVADSFDLSLTGPAGLVSTLAVNRIDLAPGESRTIAVTTNATVPFAVAGAMPLSVVSQSAGNAAIRGSASADVIVPQSVGLTASFRQANRVIPTPGTADFTLDVGNLGTGEDAYEATIVDQTGRVSAVLVDLTGRPTSSIPVFRLPGLSQGAITVRANLAAVGTGTVSVRVRSLNDPARETVRTATLGTTQTSIRPTSLLVGGATNGSAITYSPTAGQFGPGTTLTFFPGFAGDVRTATADVTGDGVDDFVGGSGPGMVAEVAIIDGATRLIIARYSPFESTFRMGVFVAAADLNGDGKADVVVTPDLGGGPVVAVYDGSRLAAGLANGQGFGQPAQLVRYFGIEGDPNFRGGARPSLGDVDGDGTPDLMVSAGFLGGPRVALFNGLDLAAADDTPRHLIPDFFAFEPTLRNGAFVALGDITGDGRAELVFGGGPTGGNRVRVFDAAPVLATPGFESLDQLPSTALLNNFFTGDPSVRGGARVAVKYIDDTGKAALITGSGNDELARVRVYSSALLLASPAPAAPDQTLNPFDAVLANGAFVG